MIHNYPIPRNPKLKNGYTWQDICDIVENVHPLFTKENMYLSTAISAYIGLEDDVLQKQAIKTADFTLSQIQKATRS
jgi:hypothetical protein